MNLEHITQTVFHAAVWRSMHFAGPHLALAIAVTVGLVGFFLSRRR